MHAVQVSNVTPAYTITMTYQDSQSTRRVFRRFYRCFDYRKNETPGADMRRLIGMCWESGKRRRFRGVGVHAEWFVWVAGS